MWREIVEMGRGEKHELLWVLPCIVEITEGVVQTREGTGCCPQVKTRNVNKGG